MRIAPTSGEITPAEGSLAMAISSPAPAPAFYQTAQDLGRNPQNAVPPSTLVQNRSKQLFLEFARQQSSVTTPRSIA